MKNLKTAPMKFYVRSNEFKARNVFYSIEKTEAYSYGWWCFLRRVEGVLVFNHYRYSNTTAKHQHRILSLLDWLNIKPEITVRIRQSLTDFDSLEGLILEAEEAECNRFLEQKLRAQEKYAIKKLKQQQQQGGSNE